MRKVLILCSCLICIVMTTACAKAPYTGRNQFIVISQSDELALGQRTAADVLKKEQRDTTSEKSQAVVRVGKRIAAVAGHDDFKWEFNTILKDDTPNAFCLPGGKVFVYTGIFPYIQNDAELAAVMGHEIGHAIARHGAERVSTALAVQTGTTIGMIALSGRDMSPLTSAAVGAALGAGVNVGIILPFSRTQEYEADRVGLILMAKAGYDPHSALDFWKAFAKQPGNKPPEFLSTHPASENRIAVIKELISEAMPYYKKQ